MTYITNAWDSYQFMNDKNILMAFTGTIDHQITTSLLKNFKGKIAPESNQTPVNKKVYSVLVESMENISKHSSQQHRSILLLSKTDDAYTVISGNRVENEDIPLLKGRLERFLNLDNSELRKIYDEQLMTGFRSENSSGLGMLEIAIKSGNNIQHHFQPLTKETSFYILQVKINIQ